MMNIDPVATRDALPFERLIDALARMFTAGCTVPARHVHSLDGGTVLIMPAWHGRYLGIKTVSIFPSNAARGLPGLFSTYLLHDGATGRPLAQIDGNEITSRRTACASALAASRLAAADASSLLVIGTGRIAALLPAAYRTVRPIERVWICGRRDEPTQALVASLQGQGFDARAVDDLARRAGEVDIVSCATLATEPVVQGAWLRAGSHLDLIGSFTPAMREADDACFVDAHLYVDTAEALLKSGDLLGPIARGVLSADSVQGTLTELSALTAPIESSSRTVFKSVGTALEDLAAAILVYEHATGRVAP
ncbi:ornithine cyclodeaminase family protein [soil metagenome]